MLFAPVGSFAVGTVEPLLEDVAVVAERMMQGFAESLVIGRSTVVGGVAVPWGDIHAHFDARLTAGLGEVAQYIAQTVAPLAVGDSMSAGRIGPQTETVVVFGGENDTFHAGCFGCGRPLAAVEGGGIEDVFASGAEQVSGRGHMVPEALRWRNRTAVVSMLSRGIGFCSYDKGLLFVDTFNGSQHIIHFIFHTQQ